MRHVVNRHAFHTYQFAWKNVEVNNAKRRGWYKLFKVNYIRKLYVISRRREKSERSNSQIANGEAIHANWLYYVYVQWLHLKHKTFLEIQ